MNQPPLNPDALEAAKRTFALTNPSRLCAYEDLPEKRQQQIDSQISQTIEAYLTVAQPVVNSFDPRELNRRGWTCGCEPGNYDSCDSCQSACDELADFLNRLEDTK